MVGGSGSAPSSETRRFDPCLVCGIRLRRGTTSLLCEGCAGCCYAAFRCSKVQRGHSLMGWRCAPCDGQPSLQGTGAVVAGRSVATLVGGNMAAQRLAREPCLACGGRVLPSCSLCAAPCVPACQGMPQAVHVAVPGGVGWPASIMGLPLM